MTQVRKIVLSGSRDIPFNLLVLSQANVRRVKAGVSIDALATDIARRGLLQSLTVRPQRDAEGVDTGLFEVPAGGRRFRALQSLVKAKRMAKTQPVPCIVRDDAEVSAEEDSLAENTHREALHPLDQFRAMQQLVAKGDQVEAIAATFMTTPAVVRQRLKLASVSPALHEIYADDGMSLDQLMAFSVSDDHARQEALWELLVHSHNRSPAFIRQRLTEDTVRASDRRARFIGIDAYVEAGGCVLRDLFEADNGGWLQDAALLDRLVVEKLNAEAERIRTEGWKWIAVAVDFPYGHLDGLRELDSLPAALTEDENARAEALKDEADAIEAEYENVRDLPDEVEKRITALDEELAGLLERPPVFDLAEMTVAGAFVSLEMDGTLCVERGWVRPEDEPVVEADETAIEADFIGPRQPGEETSQSAPDNSGDGGQEGDDEEEEGIKPLPDRLMSELTAQRTIALQDAFAQSPSIAFAAVLHSLVLSVFYYGRTETCLGLSLHQTSFPNQPPGMKDSLPAKSIAARHARWEERLPASDRELWDALALLDGDDQAVLFAHCAAYGVSALWEPVSRYDGRVSAHGVARRLDHSHVLARAVGLDMVTAGWTPMVDNYLGRVTKPRILMAVSEAKGDHTAGLIDHLKKGDMAREAERLLEGSGWLPEPLRTPVIATGEGTRVDLLTVSDAVVEVLPAFLDGGDEAKSPRAGDDESGGFAIAAE
jgi:ParB family chromosome partitioning protein